MAAIFACVGRSSTRGAFVSAATASGAGRGDDVWRMFVAIRFVCVLVKRGSCATTCVLANRGANASSDAYPLRAALLAGLRIAEMHNRATAPRESHQDNISEIAVCSAGDARLAASLQPWLQNSMCAAMLIHISNSLAVRGFIRVMRRSQLAKIAAEAAASRYVDPSYHRSLSVQRQADGLGHARNAVAALPRDPEPGGRRH